MLADIAKGFDNIYFRRNMYVEHLNTVLLPLRGIPQVLIQRNWILGNNLTVLYPTYTHDVVD